MRDHLENMLLFLVNLGVCLTHAAIPLALWDFFPSFLFFTLDNFIGILLLDKDDILTWFSYTSESISENMRPDLQTDSFVNQLFSVSQISSIEIEQVQRYDF